MEVRQLLDKWLIAYLLVVPASPSLPGSPGAASVQRPQSIGRSKGSRTYLRLSRRFQAALTAAE